MTKPVFPREFWENNVPWGKTARETADILGCEISVVRSWAKKLGKPLAREPRGPKPKIGLDEIDVRRSPRELATLHNISREWAAELRKRRLEQIGQTQCSQET